MWKDLGLRVRDSTGALVDDPRLSDVWAAAGALGLPVWIHTADPRAFFDPIDERNERVEELSVHPEWAYYGGGFPSFERLLDALEAVVARHSETTFVGVHVGCDAEDLSNVDRMLRSYRNFYIDIAARIAELLAKP